MSMPYNRNYRGVLSTFLLAFLLTCFLVILSAEAQQRAAALTIEPASGKAAAAIKIKGAGFLPGEEVDIIMQVGDVYHGLGTEKADMVVTNNNGAFDVASGIPVRTPPGVYKIEATGNKGSTATFSIEVVK
ncbi:MAG: hypothetical protein U1C55_10970 [Smithellaceae bacterium]|nr:hypothetical protein [Smithellaceae bacterium]